MLKHKNYNRVLSIYPIIKGFAFVLFDSPLSPHDWGGKHLKKDVGSVQCIAAIRDMLRRYRPDVLVLDDVSGRQTTRVARLKHIYKAITKTCQELSIEVAFVSRKHVRSAFAQFGAVTKQDIAEVIAKKMEAFAPRMPKARAAWAPEDSRMALFDAASRGLTYYYRLEETSR